MDNNRVARNKVTTSRLMLVLTLFTITAALTTPTIVSQHQQTSSIQGQVSVHGSYVEGTLEDIPELISIADAILIGEVGQVLAREYPGRYQREHYTDEEWAELSSVPGLLELDRVAFTEITTVEVLKGSVPDSFPLLAKDVEYYADINLTPIKEGEVILFFISIEKGDPSYARSYDTFYSPLGEQGVFDVEGNRAFPRLPIAFKDNNETYYNRTNASRPFVELDKLREVIAAADK